MNGIISQSSDLFKDGRDLERDDGLNGILSESLHVFD
jgi:hypothetical protein